MTLLDRARMDLWKHRAQAALSGCAARGGDGAVLEVSAPASEASIRAVEIQLGRELPASLRHVLATHAARFEIGWHLPEAPDVFPDIFSGGFGWDLDALVQLEAQRRGWIRECFSDRDNPYDRVWHDTLAIASVPNGDMLAIDLRDPAQPLVYLSHDDGEGHGAKLGHDLADAIDRWSRLGFVGPEDWQWLPFTDGPDRTLAPDGAPARRWREWLGIDRATS